MFIHKNSYPPRLCKMIVNHNHTDNFSSNYCVGHMNFCPVSNVVQTPGYAAQKIRDIVKLRKISNFEIYYIMTDSL